MGLPGQFGQFEAAVDEGEDERKNDPEWSEPTIRRFVPAESREQGCSSERM
jgi:hypothetical protein